MLVEFGDKRRELWGGISKVLARQISPVILLEKRCIMGYNIFDQYERRCVSVIDSRLREITSRAVSEYRKIFGDALVQVILYGSYARGDFDEESDIDIVALVRCDRETISSKTYAMAEFSSDLDLTFGIMVSPSALPYDEYQRCLNDVPYYSNIAREGVELIA